MFERNRVDNRAETLIAVEVVLASGEKVAGRAVLASGKAVHKLLDGDDSFIYLEGFDGEGSFVPKAEIRGLKVMNNVPAQTTVLRIPDARNFEPYRVLGLEKGASFDEIRDAHRRLSKLYHPDRYASVDLPAEVKVYFESMTRNVNAAFRALQYIARKTEPIFTRGG